MELAIERLLAECERARRNGGYRLSYQSGRKALQLANEGNIPPELHARTLLESAKNAYYISILDESVEHLAELEGLLCETESDCGREIILESTIVSANVLRRRGLFKKAMLVLGRFDIGYWQRHRPHLIPERLLIEGACNFYLNDVVRAEKKLESALGLATFHSDPRLKSRILIMLGLLMQSRGFTKKAEDCHVRARADCVANEDFYGDAAASLNLGIVLYRRGKFDESSKAIGRARRMFKKIGWTLGVCRSILAIGNVKKCRGELRSALRLYQKALRMATAEGFAREQSLAYEYIGDVYLTRNELVHAERSFRKCLKKAQTIAPKGDVEIEALRRLGELYILKGDEQEAMSILSEGLSGARALQERLEEGLILRARGKAFAAAGEPQQGIVHFRNAITVLRDAGCQFELVKTHVGFASFLLEELSDLDKRRIREDAEGVDADDEAWKCLVEASYLLSDINVPFWRQKVEKLFEKALSHRRMPHTVLPVKNGGKDIVTLKPAADYMLHERFVGISHHMQHVWRQVRFSAGFDRPVLITGETGTGKELVARTIHSLNGNSRKPFVAVNCAAIPDHLFESEFFGHRKGCFTGAVTDRKGIFEEADGGTLFLDEVGELTPLQQVKLLRVLQECSVRRIGENAERPVRLRFISATNQNIEERIESGMFREDFYYRINAEHIHVPPLRDRPADIVPLIAWFIRENDAREGEREVRLQKDALACLQRYSWPGNVRELFSVLERALHIGQDGPIMIDMLPDRIRKGFDGAMLASSLGILHEERRKRQIEKILRVCRGNKAEAARRLGISRGTLYKELRRTGLEHVIRQKPAS